MDLQSKFCREVLEILDLKGLFHCGIPEILDFHFFFVLRWNPGDPGPQIFALTWNPGDPVF